MVAAVALTRRRFLTLGSLAAVPLLNACRDTNRAPTDPIPPNGSPPATRLGEGNGTSAPTALNPPVLVVAVVPPADPGLGTDPFRLGVNSGDPWPEAVLLWTRLAPRPRDLDAGLGAFADIDLAVAWDLAEDGGFTRLVASGIAPAPAGRGHSVRVDAEGLAPDHVYYYRFRLGPWTSRTGRTRTAPAPEARPAKLVVVMASCQNFEAGPYGAHRHLAAEEPDLVLFLGDFIYEGAASDPTAQRAHPPVEAHDLATYRQRYAWYRQDLDLQAAQACAPWLVVWDDHEVANNYAATQPGDAAYPADPDVQPAFARRRAAAYQAWWENQPVRLAPPAVSGPAFGCYRSLSWGRLAHFALLDGRSQRSPQLCGVAVGVACAGLGEENRTMLGPTQEAWLAKEFEAAANHAVTWTVLGNQTALADLTVTLGREAITLFDQWDGYPAARRRLLDSARRAGVANLVAATGDLHCALAADLVMDGIVHGSEILASSISSVFAAGRGSLFELGLSLLDQVKLVDTTRRGYVRGEFGPEAVRFAFRHLADALDPDTTITTTSQWVLRNGRPGLRPA